MSKAAWTGAISRQLNKRFRLDLQIKNEQFRCEVSGFGSFISVRVNDPGGVIPLELFQRISLEAAKLLNEAGCALRNYQTSYHMGGCVTTWERA